MAEDEEPKFSSLADRIAALNKQKNFAGNANVPSKAVPSPTPPTAAPTTARRPPPPPPPGRANSEVRPLVTTVNANGSSPAPSTQPTVPPRPTRANAPPPLPRRDTQSSIDTQPPPSRPPLPSRTSTSKASPALPARRPSGQTNGYLSARRNSGSSEKSQNSTISSASLGRTASSTTSQSSNGTMYKLPPVTDMSKLPALPPSRKEREAKALEEATQAAAAKEAAKREAAEQQAEARKAARSTQPTRQPAAKPGLPPRLPSRTPTQDQSQVATTEAVESQGARRLPPTANKQPLTRINIRGFGDGRKEKPPPVPASSREADPPPPVPVASRPTAAQITAANSRTTTAPSAKGDDCLMCRDWSGPDSIAAQFPRGAIPRNDPAGYLAEHLCSPFPSYTDKARAIFTWCHHNIAYDTYSLFNNCVKNMPAEESILSGLAVCGGYAQAYKAIALRAGLECIVVTGHGKGFGHTPLEPGERPPPRKADGHAWNAVRIDGGSWKLLDACWGAGHLDTQTNTYKQAFNPTQFIATNQDFGRSHFPEDSNHQLREDGRVVDWDEYYIGTGAPAWCGGAEKEGIRKASLEPQEQQLQVNSGQVVRFQFSKICEHWTSERNGLGKPPLFVLQIGGQDGRKQDFIPIETNGYWHWADVHAKDLGAPGEKVHLLMITTIDNREARGVTANEFLSKKGRCAMSWNSLVRWQLV